MGQTNANDTISLFKVDMKLERKRHISEVNQSDSKSCNVPVKLKLQHPPPPGKPVHLTVHCARGGGNLNVALAGWGI